MGKTITTYLIDGDPKGTQYAFISNKICQMFVIPRSNLAYLNEQEKLHKPAFYILIGEDEVTKPQAYIGETENFKERVKDHDSKKAFWQKALVFVSKDEDMTKADVQYLEYRAIVVAKQSNSFVLNEKMPWMSFLRISGSSHHSLVVTSLKYPSQRKSTCFIQKPEAVMQKDFIILQDLLC